MSAANFAPVRKRTAICEIGQPSTAPERGAKGYLLSCPFDRFPAYHADLEAELRSLSVKRFSHGLF